MTQKFQARLSLVPTSSIQVDWDERYQHGDWDEQKAQSIAASIAQHDILHPPVVRQLEDGTLSLGPGGHRLKAFQINEEQGRSCPNPSYKDWTLIPVRICRGLSDAEMAVLDLVENVQRRTLSWQARTRKIFDIYKQQREGDAKWTYAQTASLIGLSEDSIGIAVRIWAFILGATSEGNKEAAAQARQCPTVISADQLIKRRAERNRQAELEAMTSQQEPATIHQYGEAVDLETGEKLNPEDIPTEIKNQVGMRNFLVKKMASSEPNSVPPACPILHTDFASFISSYSGPPFNLLHIDPPYGVGTDTNEQQGARKDWEHYGDKTEDYFSMLELLPKAADTIIAASAHIIWWFPFDHYIPTVQFLREKLLEWRIDPYPFIWHFSDSAGICPNPSESGRRTYETALFLSRNRRPLVKTGNMSVAFPKKFPDKLHQSEKPREVITHFCQMLVDDHTIALDPTTGSGRPLQAIKALGAKSVTGLERVKAIHDLATQDWIRWERDQQKKKVTMVDTSDLFGTTGEKK